MMGNEQAQRSDVWEQWDWLWTAVFYVSVLVSAGLMLVDQRRAAPAWLALLLTGLLLLWHTGGLRYAYRQGVQWDERAAQRFLIICGDILLWLALVLISPAYYVALVGVFTQVFRHLPLRYAVAAALLLTAAIIVEQVSDAGAPFSYRDPRLLVFLAIGLGGIILGAWISAIINQSMQRRELIEQLERAQAELAAAERRAGVLEERQRLAREIHDTLAQGFTSIVLHLEAAEGALDTDAAALQKHLDYARDTARQSLAEARRVVQDLRPELLDGRSLPEALGRTAERWSAETGIPLALTVTGERLPLHPQVEITLLRAAQEALSNVRKHAGATEVQLTLSYMDDVLLLDVQDDGAGLEGAAPDRFDGGYGLQAMRERVEACGGALLLESEAGEGTTVVVSMPLGA